MDDESRLLEVKLAKSGARELLIIMRDITTQGGSEQALLRLSRSFVALQAAASAVTASLEPDQVFDTFAWELTNLLSAQRCLVSEWHVATGRLQLVAAYPDATLARPAAAEGYAAAEYPLTERVLAEGYARQLRLSQLDAGLPESRFMRQTGIDTLVLLPLVYQNSTLGMVEIVGRPGQGFSEQELSIAQLLAKETAGALANARLYGQVDRQLREITTLNRIVEASASTLELETILAVVTDGTQRLLGAEAVSIALLQEDRRRLIFAAATGGAAEFIRGRELGVELGLVGWVVRHGEPLLVEDVRRDPRHYAAFDESSGFQTSALLCMPLITRGNIVGAISVMNKIGTTFDEGDQRILGLLVQPAAAAIENARLYQRSRDEIAVRQQAEKALQEERALLARRVDERTAELQRQYVRQKALAAIEPTISSPSQLSKVLDHVVDTAAAALPASGGAALVLWDDQAQKFRIMQSARTPSPAREQLARWESSGTSREILDSGKTLVVEDISQSPERASAWVRAAGLRSYAGVPLMVQGSGIGVLFAASLAPRTYAAEDLDFLHALASRAAVAIGNVRLYESLNEANLQLARLAKMKDEFLASMSHELRTPLNAILGISEGLQEEVFGTLNERQRRSVQVVEESGQHLLSLINDILEVAKLGGRGCGSRPRGQPAAEASIDQSSEQCR
jgi:GAF domain-containing protein